MQEIYKWKDLPIDFFSIDDFMNMNKAVEMIKFNLHQVTRIRKAEGIDFYKDFSYYEMYDSSIIRDFPVNFFYDKISGYFFELNKTNFPIYTLANKATPTVDLTDINNYEEEIFLSIKKYIKFFFDSVAGKHGYFHFVEDFDDIKKNIKLFYEDNEDQLKQSKIILENLAKKGMLSRLDSLIQKEFVIKSSMNKFIIKKGFRKFNESNETWFEIKSKEENSFKLNGFLIFKGVLFNTNIELKTRFFDGIQRFYFVRLSDEKEVHPTNNRFADPLNTEFKQLGFEDFLPPFHLLR